MMRMGDRVEVTSDNEMHKGTTGVIEGIYIDIKDGNIFTVKYDNPLTNNTKGMFKENELRLL